MRTFRRRRAVTLFAALSVLLVAGCSHGASSVTAAGGGPSAAQAGPSGAASAAGDPSAGASGVPSAPAGSGPSVRFVNLFAPKDITVPALDIYDAQLTGQAATPIVKNLAYGSVSAYVTPAAQSDSPVLMLYGLPAGEDPVAKAADATAVGQVTADGSQSQVTFVLTQSGDGSAGSSLMGRLGFRTVVEKGGGDTGSGPVAPPPPAGKGEILVDTSSVSDTSLSVYLMIDDSCDPPLNGNKQMGQLPYAAAVDGEPPVSDFAVFATSPGSHQVSVVARSGGQAPTCAQLTNKQSTSTVQVDAGAQILAYVYGSSPTDLRIAYAPVQQ